MQSKLCWKMEKTNDENEKKRSKEIQEHFPRLVTWTRSMPWGKIKVWKILRKTNNTSCLGIGNFWESWMYWQVLSFTMSVCWWGVFKLFYFRTCFVRETSKIKIPWVTYSEDTDLETCHHWLPIFPQLTWVPNHTSLKWELHLLFLRMPFSIHVPTEILSYMFQGLIFAPPHSS